MGKNRPRLGAPEKVLEVTLGCRPEDIAERVIVTPFVPLKNFLRHVDPETVRDLAPRFFFKGFTATAEGARITVILTGVGPSRVGDLVSILSLTPAGKILFAGAVGALSPGWGLGDFFLPTCAADGEGFTRYLTKPFGTLVAEAPVIGCSGGLEGKLKKHLASRGITAREGRVFTIGSIAAESAENLKTLASAGFDALEMELSAFYGAASHHGLKAAALTYVSDHPLESSLWQEKTPEETQAFTRAWRLLPELCIGFAASM